jgi:hypothetical protein
VARGLLNETHFLFNCGDRVEPSPLITADICWPSVPGLDAI